MHPLFVIIISIFLIGLIINNSIIHERVQRTRLSFALINLFIWGVLFFVYEEYVDAEPLATYINIYAVIIYLLFGIDLFKTFKYAILRANHYKLFIDSIKHTNYNVYYAVDERNRVKDISDSMLEELGVQKKAVLGKKIFDIFDKTIRITRFNDIEVNNKNVREYYKEYKGIIKKGKQEKREITFQNNEGNEVVLNLIEQPVYVFNKFKGRINFGEKKSSASVLNVEKELNVKNSELEGIRHKFIATLEITEEAIFFTDIGQNYIWGTDNFTKALSLPVNTIALDEYKSFINPEDMIKYLQVMQGLTEEKPNYSLTYRFRKQGAYVWVKEKGKRIFEDGNNIILGFVKLINSNFYEKVGNEELDNMRNDIELKRDIEGLFAKNRPFEIAIIKAVSIPDINDKYGRSVGNMMLIEYIKRLKQNFMTETSNIYRVSGLEFVLTITDVRKMELLKRIMESDSSSLNLAMEYGGISEKVYVKVGIAQSKKDANEAKELIVCARKALKMATNSNYNKDCCYYRDV